MGDTNEHAERIAVLETKYDAVEKTLDEIKASLDELKPLVWKAAGGATVALVIVELALKAMGGH